MSKAAHGISDIRISVKLLTGFLIISILAVILGITGILCLTSTQSKYADLYNDYGKSQGVLGQIAIDYQNTRSIMKETLIAQNDLSYKQQEVAKLAAYDKDMDDKLAAFSKTINTATGRQTYEELVEGLKQYKTIRGQVIALALQNKLDDANNMGRNELAPIVQKLEPNIQGTFTRKINNGDSLSKNYMEQGNQTIIFLCVLAGVIFFLSLIMGIGLSRNITKPMKKLVDFAQAIADGDRSAVLQMNRKDEIGIVTNAVKSIQSSVENLVAEAARISAAAVNGNLKERADESRFRGGYAVVIKGLNDTVDGFEKPIAVIVAQLRKMADGESMEEIANQYKGTYAELIESYNSVRASLYELMAGSDELIQYSGRGELKHRADASRLKGGYLHIVEGFNTTLDNIVTPLEETRKVLKEMAVGNNDLRIEGNFEGNLKDLTDAVNNFAVIINNAVDETAAAVTAIAEGRLDIGKMRKFKGSWAPISDSVNTMLDSLSDTMHGINSAAEQVAAGSRQVSDSSQLLSQGAAEQASSVEELTASIADIAKETRKNAENAANADKMASQSSEEAKMGKNQMQSLLSSMEEISEASGNISKIIKVIDDISFQTNMLALNAAVEAARAGQYGKGFAVVADEVRSLAVRSANAVKETTELIEGSTQKTQAGFKIAKDTAGYFNVIAEGSEKASALIAQIAVASNEQATAISQVDTGLSQVSQVVQTNSATAEESAASSEELSSQAELLKQMVGKFRLAGQETKNRPLTDAKKPGAIKLAAAASEKIKLTPQSGFGKY